MSEFIMQLISGLLLSATLELWRRRSLKKPLRYNYESVLESKSYSPEGLSSNHSHSSIKQTKYRLPATGTAELLTTTEYEFDNMQNPYLSFKRLVTPSKYTNQNNITKETYTIHFEVDAFIQKVQVTNNTYEYNSKAYPVKVNEEAEYLYK